MIELITIMKIKETWHLSKVVVNPNHIVTITESHEHKTVPIITKETDNGEELIGGYDDFVEYISKQKDQKSD